MSPPTALKKVFGKPKALPDPILSDRTTWRNRMILFYFVEPNPSLWIFDAERFPSFGTIFVAFGPIGIALVYAPWRT